MITLVASILVFALVITVHEFGHFICAKWSGVQVNEFSIGMGPVIFQKKYHGTKYSVRVLPIGGYVAMEGEESPESQQSAEDAEQEQQQRDALTNSALQGALELDKPVGLPFNEVALWKRWITIAAGAIMNFVLGFFVLLALVHMQDSITSRVIYDFGEDARCEQTGLMKEDEIIAVNGRYCFVANDIVYELVKTENNSANFTVIRDGEKVQLENVQFDNGVNEDGSTYMQLNFVVYGVEKTPFNVLEETLRSELYYGRIIFSSLMDLVTGRESINNLSGPVGIVSAIGTAASYGLEDVLSLLALITINLGIFNLLPLPMLDGGKLVFLAIEGVTGKPVPDRVQNAINMAGLFLFLALMIFTTYNDIIRVITGELY